MSEEGLSEESVEEVVEDDNEIEVVEELNPLEEAIARAEAAEKEIAYRDAEIQNVRKRMMAEKSQSIRYGSIGLARRMLTILADIDRALEAVEDEGLSLIRQKMWSELSADGVSMIEAKGHRFDPSTMEAITMIPSSDDSPSQTVVEVLEEGYMFKERVLEPAKVVVASD